MLEDLTKIATYYSILLFFGFMAKHFVSYHLEINGLKDSEEFNYELPYECLYDLSFNDLDKDKNDIDFSELFIDEDTPSGKIYMKYNDEDDVYYYWSDTVNIPYLFLNSVAKKYSIQFNTRYFFSEEYYRDSDGETSEPGGETSEPDGEVSEQDNNDVFVNLKKRKDVKKIKDVKKNHFKRQGNTSDFINDKDQVEKISYKNFKNKSL